MAANTMARAELAQLVKGYFGQLTKGLFARLNLQH
jgi:hypothetical protein